MLAPTAAKPASVHELFSHVAATFDSTVAIRRADRRTTYAELEHRSNQVANSLLKRNVAKSSLVAILAEDPVEIVTAILGVLKAGCVFVPMDPTFPDKRLAIMTEQVSCSRFLVEHRYLSKLQEFCSGAVSTAIDLNGDDLSREDDCRPEVESFPDDPCSIYFTSGSTGKPKAILGRLKGIDHFARWEADTLGIGRGACGSQLTSPSFDAFLRDVFVPLCAGATVCAPASRSIVREPARLVTWLDDEGVEILHCVPSVFRAVLNEKLEPANFSALRYVVLAGEAVQPADVRRWTKIFEDRIRLVNLYGPTETTLTKFCYFVQPADADRSRIPIGRPIRGATALIMDGMLQPCAVGDVGEIYIRTPYRALGYYGAPELTREAFVPNPFSSDPNDLIYRTGDYGRLLEDGNFEFLGRRDQQIKIRGVRVELPEIESLLREHPNVKDVAVIDREDAGGNKFLCAYVVVNNGTGTTTMRDHLARHFPDFMLPAAFVQLPELPRTLNGKVDRKALPSLQQNRGERKDALHLSTPVEEILEGIWTEVLNLPHIGVDENFFDLGGHSLLATQVMVRIREPLGVELPARTLFEAPTLRALAERIEHEIKLGGQADWSPMQVVERTRELPLSYSQQRMWLMEKLASGTSTYHVPMAMRMRGTLSVAVLEQTIAEVMRRHEVLRTKFPSRDGKPVQVIDPPQQIKVPIVDLTALQEEERTSEARRIGSKNGRRQFDLERGPLVRISLINLDNEDHVLACTMHHMGGDGWSIGVLVRELNCMYQSYRDGEPSRLPELKIQYADYAAWQRQWLSGEVLERRMNYWRKQLADAPEDVRLPQNRRRPAVLSFHGERTPVVLKEDLVNRLRDLSRSEGTTLFMTLLSGFLALLYQYTGQEDLLVGSIIANREREELERLIGFLANTLVLRVDLSGAPTFRQLLQRVRTVCLAAYANQLPPEKLIEELARQRADKRRLFQVWFQLERERRDRLALANVQCDSFDLEPIDVGFELSLVLGEIGTEVRGAFEYDTDLFDGQTVSEMMENYFDLLRDLVDNPDQGF